MSKFFAVFKFEFNKYLKSKVFIILTLLVVLVIGGLLSFPRIQEAISHHDGSGDDPPAAETREGAFGIINNSDYESQVIRLKLAGAMDSFEFTLLEMSLPEATAQVDAGDYDYIVILDGLNHYTLIAGSIGMQDRVPYVVDKILLGEYKTFLLAEQGVEGQDAGKILNAWMENSIVETGKNQMNTFFYTYAIVFLLYMSIILYGQLVATSVATEKSSRAMEVLVTTVPPVRMMFGKVLGTGTAALAQLFAIVGSGVFFYNFNIEYWGGNSIVKSIFDIPPQTMMISFVLFVMGFFLYSFIYAAIGSLASRVEDINSSSLPITFCMVGAFLITMYSMSSGNMDSMLIKVSSYIPLTSPMALLARYTMTDMATIEVVISMGVLFLTTIGIGYLAATIYRMGVLLYGNPPKLRGMIKLIRNR